MMGEVHNKDVKELLPHREPFLFIDKILHLENNKIIASRFVGKNESYFKGHFPGNPIVPGVLIVESMAQAAGIVASHCFDDKKERMKQPTIFYLSRIADMKLKAPVLPGATIIVTAELLGSFAGAVKILAKAEVEDKIVAEGELVLSAKKNGGRK